MTSLQVCDPHQEQQTAACSDLQLTIHTGQTEIIEINGDGDGNDFLARERAALGNDADQFVTPADHAVMVEDVEDDLLGDSQPQNNATTSEEFRGFESSFPAIDMQNEVCDYDNYIIYLIP
jgi:hypothetical protein